MLKRGQVDLRGERLESLHRPSVAEPRIGFLIMNARPPMSAAPRPDAAGLPVRPGEGVCESCGQPIGKARVLAFPQATLCVTCKQRQERR